MKKISSSITWLAELSKFRILMVYPDKNIPINHERHTNPSLGNNITLSDMRNPQLNMSLAKLLAIVYN